MTSYIYNDLKRATEYLRDCRFKANEVAAYRVQTAQFVADVRREAIAACLRIVQEQLDLPFDERDWTSAAEHLETLME